MNYGKHSRHTHSSKSINNLLKLSNQIEDTIELSVADEPEKEIKNFSQLRKAVPGQFIISDEVVKDNSLFSSSKWINDLELKNLNNFKILYRIVNGTAFFSHVKQYVNTINNLYGASAAEEFADTIVPSKYQHDLKDSEDVIYNFEEESDSLSAEAFASINRIIKLADIMTSKYPQNSDRPKDESPTDEIASQSKDNLNRVKGYLSKMNLSSLDSILKSISEVSILTDDAPQEVLEYPDTYGVTQALRECLDKLNDYIDQSGVSEIVSTLSEFIDSMPSLDKSITYEEAYSVSHPIYLNLRKLIDSKREELRMLSRPNDVMRSNELMESSSPMSFRSEIARLHHNRKRYPDRSSSRSTEQLEKGLHASMRVKLDEILHEAFHKSISPQAYKFITPEHAQELMDSFEDRFWEMDSGSFMGGILTSIMSAFGNVFDAVKEGKLTDHEIDKLVTDTWKLNRSKAVSEGLTHSDIEKAKALAKVYRDMNFVNIKKLNSLSTEQLYKLADSFYKLSK